MTNLAVVILTLNEERNIAQALRSVVGWANEVFVLDSYSQDSTVQIARQYGCQVAQQEFQDFSTQRNFAIDHLPITSEWILFLDADEWVPENLKSEISKTISSSPPENGFYIRRRLIWMGKWVRRGYYPVWILRLFRRQRGRCEGRAVNEHVIVDGQIGYLSADLIHEDRNGISAWIAKHNEYATKEALELLRPDRSPNTLRANLFGTQPERKRWIRQKVWQRLPALTRPFLFAFYRIVICGGFLDGRQALTYHLLHAFWFMLLIDLKYLELKDNEQSPGKAFP
jgi:glycosyltransferase involved in cell wall biosynthesis